MRIELSHIPDVRQVWLYGSRVRGDFGGDSDFDVLVLVGDVRCRHDVIRCLHDIEIDCDVPISPVVMTSNEFAKNVELRSDFVQEVLAQGVRLYDAERPREA